MRTATHVLTAALIAATLAPAAAAAGPWTKHKARLFGDATMEAKAIYRTRTKQGTVERRFKVEIENAATNAPFEVWVNDYFVDTIVTNGSGHIEYQLRTPQFIDEPGDGLPMPADFPDIQSLDTTVVGGMSGVFFLKSGGGGNGGGGGGAQKYKLRVDIESGNDDLEVQVKYREKQKNAGLERRFKVEVEDGEEGESLDIWVNDYFVGTVVLDDDGEAELELRTAQFIDEPDDGDPMPDDFPSLLEGDTVTAGGLVGILELD